MYSTSLSKLSPVKLFSTTNSHARSTSLPVQTNLIVTDSPASAAATVVEPEQVVVTVIPPFLTRAPPGPVDPPPPPPPPLSENSNTRATTPAAFTLTENGEKSESEHHANNEVVVAEPENETPSVIVNPTPAPSPIRPLTVTNATLPSQIHSLQLGRTMPSSIGGDLLRHRKSVGFESGVTVTFQPQAVVDLATEAMQCCDPRISSQAFELYMRVEHTGAYSPAVLTQTLLKVATVSHFIFCSNISTVSHSSAHTHTHTHSQFIKSLFVRLSCNSTNDAFNCALRICK